MNDITNEVKAYSAVRMQCLPVLVLLFLVSHTAAAQEYYADNHYLESRIIKAGESVLYESTNSIYTLVDQPFIVEGDGQVILKAGKRIELLPGFKVLELGNFSATVQATDSVLTEPVKNTLAVFPNPTDGILNVSSPQPVDAVRLIDDSGSAVMEQQEINRTDFSVDISGVKPGLYILDIISGKVIEKVRIEKK